MKAHTGSKLVKNKEMNSSKLSISQSDVKNISYLK
jgi:hypothetical protein